MPMIERFDREGFWLGLWLAISAILVIVLPGHIVSLSMCFASILLVAYSASKRLLPTSGQITSFIILIGAILGGHSLLLTLGYYLSVPLNAYILSFATLLSGGLIAFYSSYFHDVDKSTFIKSTPYSSIMGMVGALVTIVLTSFVLRNAAAHATSDAIRSPWPYLHPLLPFILGILFLLPLLLSKKTQRTYWLLPAAGAGLIALSLITSLVYTQGFGFDGFLHRESTRLLFENGTLQPKPFYYIGQYTLVVWIKQFFDLSINTIDRYLLTGLTTFLIAAFAIDRKRRILSQDLLALLFLPLSWLISTTPQSLSYLFGFTSLLLLPRYKDETYSVLPAWIFAAWSLATHPLAGLPFVTVLTGMTIAHKKPQLWRTWMSVITAFGAAFVVPAAFFVFSLLGKQAITWDFAKLLDFSSLQATLHSLLSARANASMWPDWVDLVALVLPPLTLLFAILGLSKSVEEPQERSFYQLLTFSGVFLFISGYLMRIVGDFSFLIAYERSNYADRLFTIGLILLAIPAAKGLYQQLQKSRPALVSSAVLASLLFWQSARVYNAFPRHDAGVISHGWSVGQADKEAVVWIDQDAQQRPYAVLANQSMSAAAIEALGFKRYVDDVFYYPIPTGGKLYERFLRISSENPTLDTIKEAGRLTNSRIIYVAIHNYWWDAERVREQLSALAGNEHDIDNGAITLYRFDLE